MKYKSAAELDEKETERRERIHLVLKYESGVPMPFGLYDWVLLRLWNTSCEK